MTQTSLAIVAGLGHLPKLLAEASGAVLIRFPGYEQGWHRPDQVIEAEFERLGALFETLKQQGIAEVCFAGRVDRPAFRPDRLDSVTTALLPRLSRAISEGDDAVLRVFADTIEAAGFTLVSPQQVMPDLLIEDGALGACQMGSEDLMDATKAAHIVRELGKLDIGQAAVVAGGLCLGLETLQGSDALLRFVAAEGRERVPGGARGVLFKGAKPGQDERMDLPAIGIETLRLAAQAGLAGVAVSAGKAIVVDRAAVIAEADRLGLFVTGIPG